MCSVCTWVWLDSNLWSPQNSRPQTERGEAAQGDNKIRFKLMLLYELRFAQARKPNQSQRSAVPSAGVNPSVA